MKLLLATALTTLAVCLVALGCGSDGEDDPTVAASEVPATFYGVIPQGPITADDLDRMGAGKVGTLRIVFFWQSLDATPEPGDTNFSVVDPVVLDAARNGIQILPTLFGTPEWVAEGLDGNECVGSVTGCGPFAPQSEAGLAAWKTFVSELVKRYGPDGDFWAAHPDVPQIPVRSYQIWNEQNSPSFFQPKPDPAAYDKVLSTAAQVIHKHDPGGQVMLGGMFQTSGDDGAILATDFLQDLYDTGAADDFDAVAAHPYAHSIGAIEDQVQLLHDEMVRAGDDDSSLWVTEVGASSGTGKNPLELGEAGQADLLRSVFSLFLEKRVTWNLGGVIWYAWRDTTPDTAPCDWCENAGLFPPEGLEPKPAWGAFTSFTGGT